MKVKKQIFFSVLIVLIAVSVFGFVGAVPNPASVYCEGMGYESDGEGNCIFPDGSNCSQWQYYCKCNPDSSDCWLGNFTCHFPCEEMPYKEAGESAYVFGCCEGLKKIPPTSFFDDECNFSGMAGGTSICSDCGNGNCEEWENRCNCPEDCIREGMLVSESNVSYDAEIVEDLKTQNEVDVMVILKDDNIVSNYSMSANDPEEYSKWIEDMIRQSNNMRDKVLPFLLEDEFRIKHRFETSPDFSGYITQKGLDKLIKNSNVLRIVKDVGTYGTDLKMRITEGSFDCEQDTDCEIVDLTCCGCSGASTDIPLEDLLISINKNHLSEWNEIFDKECSGVTCGPGFLPEQSEKCHSYISKCINNFCVLSNIEEEPKTNDNWLYIGLGVILLIIVLFLLIKLKKK